MLLVEVDNEEDLDGILVKKYPICQRSRERFKVGAVLVQRGVVICVGNNSSKTHPRFGSKSPYKTLHAEGSVLYNANKLGIDTKGTTMYIFRENYRNSKPCRDCQKLIREAGVSKVIYTNIL